MNDDESKDKNIDDTEAKDTDSNNSVFDSSKDSSKEGKDEQTPKEDLFQKSETDIELERVESIEDAPFADKSSDEDKDDSVDHSEDLGLSEEDHDTETGEKSADNKSEELQKPDIKAGALPVTHPEDNKKKVTLDDIIKTQKTEKKAQKKPVLWIILTVLLLLVAIGVGVAYYISFDQHNKQQETLQASVDSEKAKNASLNEDLIAVQESLAEKIDEDEKAAEAAEVSDGSSQFRTIPEWGVQYKLDDTNGGLTYSYSVYMSGKTNVERLNFSTTEISSIQEKSGQSVSYPCTSSNAPLGWIDRFSEEELEEVKKSVAGTSMAEAYDSAVKNGDYYYMTGTTQNTCSDQLGKTDYSAKLKTVQDLPAALIPAS